jgi:4-aminobutyrate aminotransferase / (S)-3-amino-2-methylpropionate transaminase / 5-aminovalerate transaminase
MNNKTLYDRLANLECPGMTMTTGQPLILESGEGAYVKDVEGRQYLDLSCGFGSLILGHHHPAHQRVFEQAAKGAYSSFMGDLYANRGKVSLLECLHSVLPVKLSRSVLALSGSQAVEIAVRTAHLATGRSRFIAIKGSYHGLELGILSLNSREDFRQPFAGISHNLLKSYIDPSAKREAWGDHFRDGDVAGVILEPVQGRGGVRPLPREFIEDLSSCCQRYGSLLIFDEVMTGMGRLGRYTLAGDIPCDLLCLGKGLGGGMPLSACVGSEVVMAAWSEKASMQGEASYTGTFFGNGLACAYGAATLTTIKEEDLLARVDDLAAVIEDYLKRCVAPLAGVRAVRGRGLFWGIELKAAGAGVRLAHELREHGVIVVPAGPGGDVISLTPPFIISEGDLLKGLDMIRSSITK